MSLRNLLLSITISILLFYMYPKDTIKEYKSSENIINNQNITNNIDGNILIEIEKINLYIYSKKDGNLKYGLKTYKDDNSIIVLGHSGIGPNCYFKNLYKLDINDSIVIYQDNIKKDYNVVDIIYFDKLSTITLDDKKEYLYLITCDQVNHTKQFIIKSKLA